MLVYSLVYSMNKIAILSIAFVASITLVVPNVYAEEGGFFDWLMNLFGGFEEKQSATIIETQEETTSKIRKAVIIDQLYKDIPNRSYHEKVTEFLTQAGYEVDLFTTADITVDFYKELPSMDYEFIVLRTHSLAIYGEKPSSWLFTGEMYSDKKHTFDTMSGLLSPGIPFLITDDIEQRMTYSEAAKKRHFMIGSKFIDESMEGTFPGSVIVMAGCETLVHSDLADSFIARGSSSVIGWNDLVESKKNDQVILSVLEEILVNELKIEDAVDSVMENFVNDDNSKLKLKYYSSGADLEI